LKDGSLGLLGLRAFTKCFSCINASGFAKKLLKEGLLESSFHKPFQIEKGEGDNFCILKLVFFWKMPFGGGCLSQDFQNHKQRI
jgi:hypothetical protein